MHACICALQVCGYPSKLTGEFNNTAVLRLWAQLVNRFSSPVLIVHSASMNSKGLPVRRGMHGMHDVLGMHAGGSCQRPGLVPACGGSLAAPGHPGSILQQHPLQLAGASVWSAAQQPTSGPSSSVHRGPDCSWDRPGNILRSDGEKSEEGRTHLISDNSVQTRTDSRRCCGPLRIRTT